MSSADITFDHYYPFDELTHHLETLQSQYPNLLSVASIGKSYEGRDIWCATVSNHLIGNPDEKPAFWIDANIHATEVSAASAAILIIKRLVEGYQVEPDITRVLDTRTFYIVPRMNPDGAELFFKEPAERRFIRSSTRPYPFQDEAVDGLVREDVDGDGRFLTMRIPDPNGAWKEHPDEPRLLVRRDPTEAESNFYRLMPEGTFDNWDGTTMQLKTIKEGLDLNRNFPAHWRQENEQFGAGEFPTSEPEVHAVVKFITSHKNITGGATYHTFSGVLLRPYGTVSDDGFPAEDLWTYDAIGKKGSELTGYPAVSVYHDFKYHPKEVITGVFDDWMYDHLGLFAWTVEIWSPQRQAGLVDGFDTKTKQGNFKFTTWGREHDFSEDLKMLKWNDTVLEGKGYVDWYPFDHPQLGPIEIGGWDAIYAFRNPPPQFLEEEIKRFPDWMIWHALVSPLLDITQVECEPLGEDTYLVRMVVQNTGWLPTNVTKKAIERKICRGVIGEIELPEGASLATGLPKIESQQLEGRAYKSVAPYGWAADPTLDQTKFEWIVVGRAGQEIKLTARHDRAGVVRTSIQLG